MAKAKADKTEKTLEPQVTMVTMGTPTPESIYRVAQGKTVLDVAETKNKYVVTQLGGLSEVRT